MQWDFVNRKLKEFFEQRKTMAIDKLFTIQPESSPLKELRIETDFVDETAPPVHVNVHANMNKSITSPKEIKRQTKKNFNQISHMFTPFGPARSQKSMQMRVIVSGTLKNNDDAYNSVKHKDIAKVKDFIDKNYSVYNSRPQSVKSSPKIQSLLTEFESDFDTTSSLYSKNVKLNNFIKQNTNINRLSIKLGSKMSTQGSIYSMNTSPKFEKIDFKSAKNPRDGFDRFLGNKWLDFVIEHKTMRNKERYKEFIDAFMKSPAAEIQRQKLAQHKLIRKQFNSMTEKKHPKPHRYYKKPHKTHELSNVIKFYDQYTEMTNFVELLQVKAIEIKRDQDNLMEFHPQYDYKVKKARVMKKIYALCRRAINLKTTLRSVIQNHLNYYTFEIKGSFAYIRYIKKGHFQAIQAYLLEEPALINCQDELGQSALMLACQRNYTQIAKFLIQSGAEVNLEDLYGYRPLYYAVQNDNIELVKLIIANGSRTGDTNYFLVCKSQLVRDIIKLSHFMIISGKQFPVEFRMQLMSQFENITEEQVKTLLEELRKAV